MTRIHEMSEAAFANSVHAGTNTVDIVVYTAELTLAEGDWMCINGQTIGDCGPEHPCTKHCGVDKLD